MFENSDLAASGLPDAAELALLAPWRDRLPPELFAREFQPDESTSAGRRDALRAAQALLAEAGWVVREGRLVSAATGAPFTIEFLLFEQSFTRVVNPYIRNLERLGIQPSIRLVDITTFENRMKEFDYDVIIRRFTQPLTPGVEQRNYWTSGAAGVIGSFNFSGIREPAVDALVEKIVAADSRAALTAATRALDRVLMWGYYTVPQWYSGTFRLAYWDKFGRPALKPRFDLGLVDTWWIDPEKQRRLPEQPQSPRG
jgi:microcin C transport system substrate-binding protein